MTHKLIIESNGIKKGRFIEGIALTPIISLNGNAYSAEAIDDTKNLNVPLPANWEHTEESVGEVIYSLDPETHTIHYKAEITNESRIKDIREGVHKVSIEASVDDVATACNKKRCYNIVGSMTMEGIGITMTPGVQTTTLSFVESYHDWKPIFGKNCEKCSCNNLHELVETKKEHTCEKCGKPKED